MDVFNPWTLSKKIDKHNIINTYLTDDTKHFSTITNLLVYQTLVYRENLKYWNKIKYSWVHKIYYGLQTLPITVQKAYYKLKANNWDFMILKDFNLLRIVQQDVKDNIAIINDKLRENYEKLGNIYENRETLEKLDIEELKISHVESIEPSFAIKYWIPITFLVFVGPILSLKIINNRNEIIAWFENNLRDVITGFYENWIVQPLKDVVNVIKQDTNIIMAKDSLNSSIESLERMVMQYLTDNKIQFDQSELHSKIEAGDLTLLMSKYEQEMQKPIKNIVNGTLIRSILIQIQKTKVDGDLVINGIDKLIKSQQLLLGIVAISPSAFIVYQLVKYFYKPNFIINGKDLKLSCLNNLVNLKQGTDNVSKGNLLTNIINLKIESKMFLNPYVFEMLENDLNSLLAGKAAMTDLLIVYVKYFQ